MRAKLAFILEICGTARKKPRKVLLKNSALFAQDLALFALKS
jgi:hypothetical protein